MSDGVVCADLTGAKWKRYPLQHRCLLLTTSSQCIVSLDLVLSTHSDTLWSRKELAGEPQPALLSTDILYSRPGCID